MNIHTLENILQPQELLSNGFSTSSLFPNQSNTPLDLVWKLHTNLQQQYLKSRIVQLIHFKNQLLQQTINKISLQNQFPPLTLPSPPLELTVPSSLPFELSSAVPVLELIRRTTSNSSLFSSEKSVKVEADDLSPKQDLSVERGTSIKIEAPEEKPEVYELKSKLKMMLLFFINNYGKISEEFVQAERFKYEKDLRLLNVFDILTKKYSGASKSREEMIKYVLRKALKAVRNNMQKRLKIDYKEASSLLCKRYFKRNMSEEAEGSLKVSKKKKTSSSSDDEDEGDGEEELLKAMLPFRKNSKNKTMNSNFITEIFSSEEFCKDYEVYLTQIDDILEKDNSRKIDMFLRLIEDRMKKNQVEAIQNCKRMPWLRIWIDATKNVAFELATTKAWIETRKKVNGGL